MSLIKIFVNNEVSEIVKDNPEITSGGISNVEIEFSFSSEWDGYKKTVFLYKGFYDKEKAVWVLLDGNKIRNE